MKKISYVDEFDNWSPDNPLSYHTIVPAEKSKENFPEELAEE